MTTTEKPDIIDAIDEAILEPEQPAATVVPNKTVAKVETIDAEVVEETKPMTKTAAKALDKKIKAAANTAVSAWDALLALLAEAQAGHIHTALGLRSWTEYLETITLPPMLKNERDAALEKLAEEGVPSRTAAKMTGVSPSTAQRKAREVAAKAEKAGATKPAVVTSVDGKKRPAAKKPAAKKPAAERVSVKGKPPTMRAIRIGEVASDLEKNHFSKFQPGEIHNIRRIAKAAAQIISGYDNDAANNRTAKA